MKKTYYQTVSGILLLIFLFLGFIVRFHLQMLAGFDKFFTHLVRIPYPSMNDFFLFVTKFGNPLNAAIIFLCIFLLLLIKKYRTEACWLAINFILIAGALNPLIKLYFSRERPTLQHLVTEHSYSFPSGHSLGSMVLYGTLIFLAPLFFKNKRTVRFFQFFLALVILTIGVSRIYLGVHFPSDILGGYLLGASWLFFTYPIYQKRTNFTS